MASFLRRPSNTAAAAKKNGVQRFGSSEPPPSVAKPTKKGSFISLISKGQSSNDMYFDNGVDPLGRLSTDSAPPPPPSPMPTRKIEAERVPRHWIEELFPLTKPPGMTPSPSAELIGRVRYFLQQKDPSVLDRSLHLALYAQQEGEPALNAKLFHRFGDGLPLRVPGHKVRKDEGPVPRTLRELLRTFLYEHDPGFLTLEGESGLDEMMARAAEYGIDALESELVRKYGAGLASKSPSLRLNVNHSDSMSPVQSRERDAASFDMMAKAAAPMESSSPSPLSPVISQPKPTFESMNPGKAKPRLEKVKSEQPQTFIELGLDEEDDTRVSAQPLISPLAGAAPKPRRHDFFDDKSLRADLKAFYSKHDQKKLEPQKFEPIVQWAYKIGPSELNRRFEEKYGESLITFVENLHAGRPGVSPGPKIAQTSKIEEATTGTETPPVTCNNYREVKPGKSFGVCVCGFSRVDHKQVKTLLVSGTDEPHFNRAKPKTVMSKNPTPAKASQQQPVAPKTAIPAPTVTPKSTVTPQPTFEVKPEGRDGPCSEYRLDLGGRSFGVCKCGWSRPEHYKVKQQVAWATAD